MMHHPYWEDHERPWSEISLEWGIPLLENTIQVGVIKMTGDNDFNVVTFPSNANYTGFSDFNKTCQRIRLAHSPNDLGAYEFTIWCRKGQEEFPWDMDMVRSVELNELCRERFGPAPGPATVRAREAESSLPTRPEFVAGKHIRVDLDDSFLWVYRPLDVSDMHEAPFDVNTWYAVDY